MAQNEQNPEPTREDMLKILSEVHTIAMVGASDNPEKPSHGVMKFLQSQGFRIFPVNPALAGQTLLGEKVYPDLAALPEPVDMVEIFRNSEAAGPISDQAIEIGAKIVWMQLGVTNPEAAARARAKGLKVVMNNCPAMLLGH